MNRFVRCLPAVATLLAAILLFGCSNELTAPTEPAFAVAQIQPVSVLTTCQPQPAAMTGAWIGPQGGILRVGKHTLKVPMNALSTPVWITMEAPSSTINRVVFTPEGLTFKVPAKLTMSYSNCLTRSDAIVYINDQYRIIETTPSQTDRISQTVNGAVSHFSDYALSTYAVAY